MWASGIPGHNSSRIVPRPPVLNRRPPVAAVTVVRRGSASDLDDFAKGAPGVFDPTTGGTMVFNNTSQRIIVNTDTGTKTVAWRDDIDDDNTSDDIIIGPTSGRRFKLAVNPSSGALEVSKETGVGSDVFGGAIFRIDEE